MDLTMLLIGASVAAGAHMVLFFGAATLAWVYFKRCKKLRAQLAQDEIPDDRDESDRQEGRDNRNSESDHTADHRRSRDGNRHRESATGRARRERRNNRVRRSRPQNDSSPYPDEGLGDESREEDRRERSRATNSKRRQDDRSPKDVRQSKTA